MITGFAFDLQCLVVVFIEHFQAFGKENQAFVICPVGLLFNGSI